MTWPTEVKPREGDAPGTPAAGFDIGSELPELRFTITPKVIETYVAAIDGDASLYELDGRPVAPPNVLAVYQLAVLYRRYPPIQGIILTEQEWTWKSPIWADEDTDIVAGGRIVEVFEKRGKQYLRWSAEFHRPDGTPVAASMNAMYLPE